MATKKTPPGVTPLRGRQTPPPPPIRSAEIRSVAEQLKAGELSAEEAVDKIARQAAERIGAALTGTAMHELEGMLKDLTKTNPYLAGKLAKLKKTKP